VRRAFRWLLLAGCTLLSACSLMPGSGETDITTEVVTTTASGVTTTAYTPAPIVVTTEVVTTPSTSEPIPTSVSLPSATTAPLTVVTLPDPAAARWQVIASGLDTPVGMGDAGDGTGRLFIIEQGGLIRIWQAGSLLSEPFLDLRERVACCGERGLLGLAFHPDYADNGYFYVNYTQEITGDLVSRVSRFQVSADPDRADPQSELLLLEVLQPFENHNGGGLAFGPDGYLYIALGDGGSGGDPQGNGQSLTTLLGKLLRIDVDQGSPYAIPPDNPFVGSSFLPEIWAYGLRNPWRFSFDPLTGDLYIGDVGQGNWEEIDFLPAGSPGGANFGWNIYEGVHHFSGAPDPGQALMFPVAEYGHDVGSSVTGGMVYRGTELPDWSGVYLYGDFASGRVWGLLRGLDAAWQNNLLFETGCLISSFGQDASGEVYLVNYSGELLRLVRR
jgi:glucose/arabinose dehydrogenase